MWLILSFITAIGYAVFAGLTKKVSGDTDYRLITWSMFSFAIPFTLVAYLLSQKPEVIQPAFYYSCSLSILLNMLGYSLFVRALEKSELSIGFPFLSFSPLLLSLTAYLFLGEIPSALALLGIICIAMGAYIINIKNFREGFLAPFRYIMKEPGVILMIFVAIIWSIAGALDKVAVQASSPTFYLIVFNIIFSILYIPFLMFSKSSFKTEEKTTKRDLVLLGTAVAVMSISQMAALHLANVSYVIAIKRSGMVLGLFIGWLFFNEKLTVYKLIATCLMLVGVFFISFSSISF